MYDKRITDVEVFEMIKTLDKCMIEDEHTNIEVMKTLLALMADTRILVRKVYKNMVKQPKVYKRPTGNKNDIIVGKKEEV